MSMSEIIDYRLFYSACPDHPNPAVRRATIATGSFKTIEEFDSWWKKHGETRRNGLKFLFGDKFNLILKFSNNTGRYKTHKKM